MTIIINIENSPLRNKRFRIYLLNGDKYDIGNIDSRFYIDHKNKLQREMFYKLLNSKCKDIIYNLTPCPLLYETFILNGFSKNIINNINFFNKEILRSF